VPRRGAGGGLALGLLLALYLLSNAGYLQTTDTMPSVATAASLLHEGSLRIDAGQSYGPDLPPAHDGKTYSRYGIGLALAYLPAVAVADGLASRVPLTPWQLRGLLVSFMNPWIGVGACLLFHRIARRLGAPVPGATFAALALGAASSLWPYSVHDHTENLQMLGLLAAYLALIAGRDRSWLPGTALALLILVAPVHAVAALPAAAYLWATAPSRAARSARVLRLAVPVAGAVVILLVQNQLRFGSPLEFGYGRQMQFSAALALRRLPGLLLSPERGVLLFDPVLLVTLPSWPRFWRRRRAEAALALGLSGLAIAVGTAYVPGDGWSWGPRRLVPVLPFLLLPLLEPRSSRWPLRLATGALLVASFGVQLLGVLPKSQEYNSIRYQMTGHPAEDFPAQLPGTAVVLWHKLTDGSNSYSLRSFGLDDDARVDTGASESNRGLNLWFLHAARELRLPWLRWLALPLAAAGLSTLTWLLHLGCRSEPNAARAGELS